MLGCWVTVNLAFRGRYGGPGRWRFLCWRPSLSLSATISQPACRGVLSAIEHGQSSDIPLVARIASAAILASADIDVERSRLYLDLILISLSQNAPEAFEATMNSLGYEYQSDFARKYFTEGEAQGEARGEARGEGKAVLAVLEARAVPISDEARERIASCTDSDQLMIWISKAVTVKDSDELFG